MLRNPDIPATGLVLTMDQHCEIEILARFIVSFETCIWAIVGCAPDRLNTASRSLAIGAWRGGLATGEARLHEILSDGAERGNQNAAAVLYSKAQRAVPELRQQIISSWSTSTEEEAHEMLRSVDDAAAEQRKLLGL